MEFFFIQMADSQFGMFAALSGLSDAEVQKFQSRKMNVKKAPKITGFANETGLYEKAIDGANRLSPAFVVVCGDLVNDANDQSQVDELMRISTNLDDHISMRWVAGNHDVGNTPTNESLALYRERFGEDNYSFHHQGSSFIVINSCVCFDPSEVPQEWEKLIDFLKNALQEAIDKGSNHILVFTHHPLFLQDPEEEEETPFVIIPKQRRRVILDLLKAHDVSGVFSGHWHRNVYGSDGDMQMVTSGAVGYPLGDDPSGFRVVKVFDDRIEHEYFGFGELPEAVEIGDQSNSDTSVRGTGNGKTL